MLQSRYMDHCKVVAEIYNNYKWRIQGSVAVLSHPPGPKKVALAPPEQITLIYSPSLEV